MRPSPDFRWRDYWGSLASLQAQASPSAQAARRETQAHLRSQQYLEYAVRGAQCPQPAEADISPKEADSGFAE
jgi:hypothetical protein